MPDVRTVETAVGELPDLRRRFKAICEATQQRFQNYQIRVHRALSWLERALEMDAKDQPDGRLLYSWIAFNSLYGTWDEEAGFPGKDRDAWQGFLGRLMEIDKDGLLGKQIVSLRPRVMSLLENKFLDPQFWRDPQRAHNHRGRYHKAQSLYFEKRWCDILTFVLDRVYVLRGQIVHGAATRGSSLNRTALQECNHVLEGLLIPMLHLAIENGAHDDWPPLCYPPVYEERPAGNHAVRPRRAR